GLGKTRLAQEFIRHCERAGCRALRGYCESYLAAAPLQPFQQMLRELLEIDHAHDPAEARARIESGLAHFAGTPTTGEMLRHLLSVPEPSSNGAKRRRPGMPAVLAGLREILAGAALRKPLVMFIDDWQWADDATHQALDAVCGIDQRPILVIVATRGFGAADATLRQAFLNIELPPLSEEDAAQSIRRL